MKLYATATGDRGKPVAKSSNDVIEITLTGDRRAKFDIRFYGDYLEIMRYSDASVEKIEYIKER